MKNYCTDSSISYNILFIILKDFLRFDVLAIAKENYP
jgi:hypothetical protein